MCELVFVFLLSIVKAQIQTYESERTFLTQELRTATSSKSRAQINLDYLKSIMVRFLQFEHYHTQRKALIPVIATLLQFSTEERKLVEQSQNGTWLGSFWNSTTPQSNPAIIPAALTIQTLEQVYPASTSEQIQHNDTAGSTASIPSTGQKDTSISINTSNMASSNTNNNMQDYVDNGAVEIVSTSPTNQSMQ